MKNKITFGTVILHTIIAILLFMLLYPLVMTLWCSFKSDLAFDYARWYPTLPIRWTTYTTAFPLIWRYILNTVFVAVVGTAGMLFISSISAFTFARMKFPGREFLYTCVIALMMIPGILSLVPGFMIYKHLGLLNSYWVLIIPIVVGAPVFGIFLLRAFFEGIPEEVFEAARIDGAGEFLVYKSICLPLSIPIMGTLAIMQIVGVWNDFVWPRITIQDDKLMTISAGLLMRFTSQVGSNYPLTFAGYMIASVPLIILFTFANKYYIEGLTSSALKL